MPDKFLLHTNNLHLFPPHSFYLFFPVNNWNSYHNNHKQFLKTEVLIPIQNILFWSHYFVRYDTEFSLHWKAVFYMKGHLIRNANNDCQYDSAYHWKRYYFSLFNLLFLFNSLLLFFPFCFLPVPFFPFPNFWLNDIFTKLLKNSLPAMSTSSTIIFSFSI